MKILLLSRYSRVGASSRIRSLQYLPFFESKGWRVDVNFLFSDRYLQALYTSQFRGIEVISGYWNRLKILLRIKKYDLIWIEKEVLPFVPALLERFFNTINVPYVVDYDDALFHRYDTHNNWFFRRFLGGKINVVMEHAALVVVGNDYLAKRARGAGARQVEIVPTVVDLTRYKIVRSINNSSLVVGWIGTPKTSRYLIEIGPVFEKILEKGFDVQFVAIGANKEAIQELPVRTFDWAEETEVKSIQALDIGIMPLSDSPWERGKCGYKLIQYMACGLPVVASPVGANKQIVQHGVNGYLAYDLDEWEHALNRLLRSRELRIRMGDTGRKDVERRYTLQVQAPRLEKFMRNFI